MKVQICNPTMIEGYTVKEIINVTFDISAHRKCVEIKCGGKTEFEILEEEAKQISTDRVFSRIMKTRSRKKAMKMLRGGKV